MPDEPARIRILCVEDHRIVREGLGLIIDREPDMTMVGAAACGEEALDLFARLKPDVTLMDLQLGRGMSGVEAIRAIRKRSASSRIVVLTMYQGDEDIHLAIEAGATTYLLKDTLADDLMRIVRQVHAGERPLRADIAARLAERYLAPTLTRREVQVLELLSQGMRNKEVADVLGIADETVHVHVRNILTKLGVNERSRAICVALRRGIIHLSV